MLNLEFWICRDLEIEKQEPIKEFFQVKQIYKLWFKLIIEVYRVLQ